MSIYVDCMYLIHVAQTSTFFDNEIESIECFEHWYFVSAENEVVKNWKKNGRNPKSDSDMIKGI